MNGLKGAPNRPLAEGIDGIDGIPNDPATWPNSPPAFMNELPLNVGILFVVPPFFDFTGLLSLSPIETLNTSVVTSVTSAADSASLSWTQPLRANSCLTLLKYVVSGYPYAVDPLSVFVL